MTSPSRPRSRPRAGGLLPRLRAPRGGPPRRGRVGAQLRRRHGRGGVRGRARTRSRRWSSSAAPGPGTRGVAARRGEEEPEGLTGFDVGLRFCQAVHLACDSVRHGSRSDPTPPDPRHRPDGAGDHREPGRRRRVAAELVRARSGRRRGARAGDRRRDRDRRPGARPRAGRRAASRCCGRTSRTRRRRSSSGSGRRPRPWSPSCGPASRRRSGPTAATSPACWPRHFGAESSTAVQHQVRSAVAELLNESREKLFKQFSSADESNPLATFQRAAVAAIRQSSDQQHTHLREMNGRIGELQLEVPEAAGGEGEGARGRRRARPLDRQGPPVRGGGVRGGGGDRDRPGRRLRRASATCAASAAARATWWWTSTAAPAGRAGGSSSRPRTPRSRARRRSPSSTRR